MGYTAGPKSILLQLDIGFEVGLSWVWYADQWFAAHQLQTSGATDAMILTIDTPVVDFVRGER